MRGLSDRVLRSLAHDESVNVRVMVAMRPDLPADLVDDLSWDVRASVLVDDRPDAMQAGVAAGLRVFKPAHEYCQWGGGTVFHDWADVPRLLGVL